MFTTAFFCAAVGGGGEEKHALNAHAPAHTRSGDSILRRSVTMTSVLLPSRCGRRCPASVAGRPLSPCRRSPSCSFSLSRLVLVGVATGVKPGPLPFTQLSRTEPHPRHVRQRIGSRSTFCRAHRVIAVLACPAEPVAVTVSRQVLRALGANGPRGRAAGPPWVALAVVGARRGWRGHNDGRGRARPRRPRSGGFHPQPPDGDLSGYRPIRRGPQCDPLRALGRLQLRMPLWTPPPDLFGVLHEGRQLTSVGRRVSLAMAF